MIFPATSTSAIPTRMPGANQMRNLFIFSKKVWLKIKKYITSLTHVRIFKFRLEVLFSSLYNFDYNGMMEPHMTENYTCLCI